MRRHFAPALFTMIAATATSACKTPGPSGSSVASNPIAAAFGAATCDKLTEAARKKGTAKLIELVMLLEYLARNNKDLAAAATLEEALQILRNPNHNVRVAERLQALLATVGATEGELMRDGKFDERKAAEIAQRWSERSGQSIADTIVAEASKEFARDPAALLEEIKLTEAKADRKLVDDLTRPSAESQGKTSPEARYFELMIEAAHPESGSDARVAEAEKRAATGLAKSIGSGLAAGAEPVASLIRMQMDGMTEATKVEFRKALGESAAMLLAHAEAPMQERGERLVNLYADIATITPAEARATALLRMTDLAQRPELPEPARVRLALATAGFEVSRGGQPIRILSEESKRTLETLEKSYAELRGGTSSAIRVPTVAETATRMRTVMEEIRRSSEVLRESAREVRVVRRQH